MYGDGDGERERDSVTHHTSSSSKEWKAFACRRGQREKGMEDGNRVCLSMRTWITSLGFEPCIAALPAYLFAPRLSDPNQIKRCVSTTQAKVV